MTSGDSQHIKVYCACGAGLKVPPQAIGKKIKCPKCETVFVADEEDSPFELSPLDTSDEDSPAEREVKPKPPAPPPPPASNKPGTPCPLCGQSIAAGAVMCVACGYDTRTGRRISIPKPAVAMAAQLAKSAGTFLLGCILSGVGALVGAAIWLGIGVATNYEIGWIAWAIGLLAGAGMALGYRQYNTRAGVVAAAISLGGILLGKAAFFIFVVYAVVTGDTSDVTLQRGHLIHRHTDEELDKRGVWDPKEREKQWDAVQAEAEKRIESMSDAEVQALAQSYQDEEAADAESFTEVGRLRSRLAWHDAEREAETKGLSWTDPQREKLLEKSERKLRLLPESQLKVREKELDAWQTEGRWADSKYIHDRLVYEFIEEDLRDDPPAEMEGLNDLAVEEWDVPDKVWRERHQIALDDVKEMNSEERVAKLKEMELKREIDEMRERIAYHRAEIKADRDGVPRFDWEARRVLSEQQEKELEPLTHEQLTEETAKLEEWIKEGKSTDAAYLRDQLIYAHIDLEVARQRNLQTENAEEPLDSPSEAEWNGLYAEAKAKVGAIPPEQHAQQFRDIDTQLEQLYKERMENLAREETREMAGALATGFFQTMFRPLDILFILLALSTAYRIGSHGFSKDNS